MAIVSVLSSKLERDDAVELGHRLGDRGQHLGRDRRVAEADHLHAHLLGQALGQLVVGDQAHADGDLAEHLAGPLLLLLQQHLQAILAEKTEVHQNLTDPPNCHR